MKPVCIKFTAATQVAGTGSIVTACQHRDKRDGTCNSSECNELWRAVCRQATGQRDQLQFETSVSPERTPHPASATSYGERCAVRPPGSGTSSNSKPASHQNERPIRRVQRATASGVPSGLRAAGPAAIRNQRLTRTNAPSGERCAVRPPGSGTSSNSKPASHQNERPIRRVQRATASGVPSGLRAAGPAPIRNQRLTRTNAPSGECNELRRAVCRQASGQRDQLQFETSVSPERTPHPASATSYGERCAVRPPGSGTSCNSKPASHQNERPIRRVQRATASGVPSGLRAAGPAATRNQRLTRTNAPSGECNELRRAVCRQATGQRDQLQFETSVSPERTPHPASATSYGERCAVRPLGSGTSCNSKPASHQNERPIRRVQRATASGVPSGLRAAGPAAIRNQRLTRTNAPSGECNELRRAVCRQASGQRDQLQFETSVSPERTPHPASATSYGERCAVRPPGSGTSSNSKPASHQNERPIRRVMCRQASGQRNQLQFDHHLTRNRASKSDYGHSWNLLPFGVQLLRAHGVIISSPGHQLSHLHAT